MFYNQKIDDDKIGGKESAGNPARKKFPISAVIACALLIAADQASKFLAVKFLRQVDSVALIPGFIDLTYVENEGVAFGLFRGGRWFFVALTLLLAGTIVYFFRKIPPDRRLARFSMILILAGAAGNLINRLLSGFVVDFFRFQFIDFPVFNVADCLVVVGTILFAALLLFGKKTWTS